VSISPGERRSRTRSLRAVSRRDIVLGCSTRTVTPSTRCSPVAAFGPATCLGRFAPTHDARAHQGVTQRPTVLKTKSPNRSLCCVHGLRWAPTRGDVVAVFGAKRSDARSPAANSGLSSDDYIAQKGTPEQLAHGARDGVGQAHRRLRHVKTLGQHSIASSAQRRLSRQLDEPARAFRCRSCRRAGLAGVVRRPRVSKYQEVVCTSGNSFVRWSSSATACTRAR